jgi:hypothetical protein
MLGLQTVKPNRLVRSIEYPIRLLGQGHAPAQMAISEGTGLSSLSQSLLPILPNRIQELIARRLRIAGDGGLVDLDQ